MSILMYEAFYYFLRTYRKSYKNDLQVADMEN